MYHKTSSGCMLSFMPNFSSVVLTVWLPKENKQNFILQIGLRVLSKNIELEDPQINDNSCSLVIKTVWQLMGAAQTTSLTKNQKLVELTVLTTNCIGAVDQNQSLRASSRSRTESMPRTSRCLYLFQLMNLFNFCLLLFQN